MDLTHLISAVAAVAVLGLFSCCQGKKAHDKLLLGGSGWNKLVILDKNTKKIEWEHPIESDQECNSVAATPQGNILYSYKGGAKLITRDHKELWNIPAPDGCEMQTAFVMDEGNYLLAWCGHPATILEVTPEGKILSKTEYETGIDNPHAQFRQVRKNKHDNYLIPLFETGDIREVTPKGDLIRIIKIGGTPFTTAELPNGNHLIAGGDGHYYMEMNLDTEQVIRKINADDMEGVSFYFVAGLLPTPEGGEYVCNWQGHGTDANAGKHPQLIEVNKEGKIIWSLNDNEKFGMISSVSLIR
ncbi:beta-propeller domain-containing protein [Parabacteroides pacaensis]|uniref:beta-propeller domain-containing protein n=1 Tax=Parabacteroides pacaensis TaxID=2086575 RepID=UPI001F31F6B0|nr:hypothetical protein [Parabacteroides pacaensis]